MMLITRKTYIRSIVVALLLMLISSTAFAQGFGYGGNGDKVTVCKATGSRFNPYVKVTVPEQVAEKFLKQGSVLPDAQGKCPKGVDVREYIKERQQQIFERVASILDRVFGRFS